MLTGATPSPSVAREAELGMPRYPQVQISVKPCSKASQASPSSGTLRDLAGVSSEIRHHAPQPSKGFHSLFDIEEIEPLGPLEYRHRPFGVFGRWMRHRCGGEVIHVCAVDCQLEDGDVVVE